MNRLSYNPPPEKSSTPGKPTMPPPPKSHIVYEMQWPDPSAMGITLIVKPGTLANQSLILEKLDKILSVLEKGESDE